MDKPPQGLEESNQRVTSTHNSRRPTKHHQRSSDSIPSYDGPPPPPFPASVQLPGCAIKGASWDISRPDPRALLDTSCSVSVLARIQDAEFFFQFKINNLPGPGRLWGLECSHPQGLDLIELR